MTAEEITDPDEAPQYALPLVIRVERTSPPTRTDALEGAARAVLTFLADPRVTGDHGEDGEGGEGGEGGAIGEGGEDSEGAIGEGGEGGRDGEWAPAVRAWEDARIRKVVRRARGAAWERALALPGITVVNRSAEIRVYPPVPVDDWPPDLARLQVAGTELEDPAPPGEPGAQTPVLWLNPGLPMTAGKAMAQAGHAAQLAWWRLGPRARAEWRALDFDLAVRTAAPQRWAELVYSGLPVVRDGGFTEVAPGSCTVVADVPALRADRGAVRQ